MITREFTLGDTLVSLSAKLWRNHDEAVVLGAAETVTFRMVNTSTGAVKIAGEAAAIVSRGATATNTPAEVRYDWAAADVDTAGEYAGWFIRTSGGETEHFPSQDPDSPELKIIIRART